MMGVSDLKDAFNGVAEPAASATAAFLSYVPGQGTEWTILTFSGNYADGSAFRIRSDRLRPNQSVIDGAKTTAAQLLAQPRAAPT